IQEYLALRRTYARCGVQEYLAGRVEDTDRDTPLGRPIPLSRFDESSLVGFFPPERWNGETYRWSGSVGVILISLDARAHRFRLDIRPTGVWSVRHPRLYFNGHALRPDGVYEKDGRLTFDVPAGMFVAGGKQRLAFTCEPFVPA